MLVRGLAFNYCCCFWNILQMISVPFLLFCTWSGEYHALYDQWITDSDFLKSQHGLRRRLAQVAQQARAPT